MHWTSKSLVHFLAFVYVLICVRVEGSGQTTSTQNVLKIPGLLATMIAVGAAFAIFSVLLPTVPLAVIDQTGSDALAGTATAVFMGATVLTQLVTAALIRRFGYRLVMVVASFLLGMPALGYLVSMDPSVILLVAAIRGCGFGSLCVAQFGLLGQIVPPGALGKASGIMGIFVGGSQMIFLPTGMVMIDAGLSVHTVFILAAALSAIAVGLCFLTPNVDPQGLSDGGDPIGPSAPKQHPSDVSTQEFAYQRRKRRAAFRLKLPTKVTIRTHKRGRTGQMWVTLAPAIALMSVSMGYGSVTSFLPAAIREVDPYAGATLAGVVMSVVGLGAMISRLYAGALADRKQRPGITMLPALIICGLGLGAMVAVLQLGVAAWWLLLAGFLFGIGYGMVQNDSLLEMFLRVPRSKMNEASTIWNFAFDAGTGTGAMLLGMVAATAGYTGAFAVGAALVIIGFSAEVIDRLRRRAHSSTT